MAGYGDGGVVSVTLQLMGLKTVQTDMKRFERLTKVTMEKAKRATIGFGKTLGKNLLTSLKNATAGMIKFAAASAALGGAFLVFNSLRTGIQNAISLDRSLALLNRTLGAGGQAAAQYARNLGKVYGTGITKTVKAFAQFSAAATAANVSLEVQQKVFEQTTKAGIAFGLSQEQTSRAFQALQQIASKGVASMEELRQQLGEQVPIALAATAEGAGITAKALIDMISSGDLSSKDFFEFYAKGMERFTKGADSADIAAQALNKFKTAWEELNLVFTESILPEIVQLMKDLIPLMEGVGSFRQAQRITGGKRGLFGPVQNALGQQSTADKAVLGFQAYLKSFGYTVDQANALITDAVKDVKGEAYVKPGIAPFNNRYLNINNKKDADAVSDRLIDIVLDRRARGIDPKSQAAAATSARDKKIADAQAAEKLAQQEKEIAKLQKDAAKFQTEQAKKRLDIQSKIIEQTIGAEAASAYKASEQLKVARRNSITAANAVFDAKDPVARAQAEITASQAQQTAMTQASESALQIRDSITAAAKSAQDAQKALTDAKLGLAGFLTGDKEGIGKYLTSGQNSRRRDRGRGILLARARELRTATLSNLGGAARSTFASNTNLKSFSVKELQDFIKRAGGELEAQQNLAKANQDLTKANNNLSEVMKIAANNQVDTNESNAQLTSTINELVNKNWVVNVEVPSGGSASGDVVMSIQNALQ